MSTRDQNPDSQHDALAAAGCDRIFVDKAPGKLAARPQLSNALDYLRSGDTLVITWLSRAARSLRHLLELTDTLRERGIDLVVRREGIDTTSPTGRLVFHVLGAIDEFTRELIVEGTHEGLAAARARGRHGGRKSKLGGGASRRQSASEGTAPGVDTWGRSGRAARAVEGGDVAAGATPQRAFGARLLA